MNALNSAKNKLEAKWFVCRVTSSRKSALYGIRFSYPLYISLVLLGVFFVNPYVLFTAALIAFFGVLLPMHPFDYLYNVVLSKLFDTKKIPGRGSELQISSSMALIFNIVVIATILYEININISVLMLLYIFISIFFIAVQLIADNFSIYSVYNFLFKRGK